MTTPNSRLYRPMPPEFFPTDSIIATLDEVKNIVFYRRDIVDALPWSEQRKVYYLNSPYVELSTTTASDSMFN